MNSKKSKSVISNFLTQSEKAILQFVSEGLSNQAISTELAVSVNTVKFHLKNIYKKLQVNNRIAAINAMNQLNQIK